MSVESSIESQLQSRLVEACLKGDLLAAQAAVAEGASVIGTTDGWPGGDPLCVATTREVVTWLLSRGADPNLNGAMCLLAGRVTADVLQLLVDAGADVNWRHRRKTALFFAVEAANNNRDRGRYQTCEDDKDRVRVLVAQPSLELPELDAAEKQARSGWSRLPEIAALIATEVRLCQGLCLPVCGHTGGIRFSRAEVCIIFSCLVMNYAEDKTSRIGTWFWSWEVCLGRVATSPLTVLTAGCLLRHWQSAEQQASELQASKLAGVAQVVRRRDTCCCSGRLTVNRSFLVHVVGPCRQRRLRRHSHFG